MKIWLSLLLISFNSLFAMEYSYSSKKSAYIFLGEWLSSNEEDRISLEDEKLKKIESVSEYFSLYQAFGNFYDIDGELKNIRVDVEAFDRIYMKLILGLHQYGQTEEVDQILDAIFKSEREGRRNYVLEIIELRKAREKETDNKKHP
jgi:hypothetical protein